MPSQIRKRISKKTGKASWTVQFQVGISTDGKPQYECKTFKKERDAKAHLNKLLRERDTGMAFKPSAISVNDFLDQWLENIARPRLRENTFSSYSWILGRYIRPMIGNARLCDLTAMRIQNIYTRMTRQGLSSRTVRYTATILKNALGQAVKWRYLTFNPCDGTELPRRNNKEMSALSLEEALAFLEALKGTKHEALLSLALYTGLRPSEYLALRWKPDVDLERGTITVNRSIARVKQEWLFREPKTQKSHRSVPLVPELINLLERHRIAQLQERLARGRAWIDMDLVFCNEVGQPLDRGAIMRNHFRPILRSAGLNESLRLYDLRHSCATLLFHRDVHPKLVSEILGHSSIQITLDTYTHVLPNMKRGAMDLLGEALRGEAKPHAELQDTNGRQK